MSISVAMDGEVRSRSTCEMKPLDSSALSASSSCVSPLRILSSFNFAPMLKCLPSFVLLRPCLRHALSVSRCCFVSGVFHLRCCFVSGVFYLRCRFISGSVSSPLLSRRALCLRRPENRSAGCMIISLKFIIAK